MAMHNCKKIVFDISKRKKQIKIFMKLSESKRYLQRKLQSPVFLNQYLEILNNINQQMAKVNQQFDIWEQLINFTQENLIEFEDLEQYYDIKKFELEKITAHQLRSKRKELQQRNQDHNSQSSKTWQSHEKRIFVWFFLSYMKFYGKDPHQFTQADWNLIAKSFKKHVYVCQYFCYSCKKSKSEPWTPEEDQIIRVLMFKIFKQWSRIGLQLYRMTNKRCLRKPQSISERWNQHLSIKLGPWSIQQDLKIIDIIINKGRQWSLIGLQLNRSASAVMARFRSIRRKFSYSKETNQNKFCIFIKQEILKQIENTKSKPTQLRRNQSGLLERKKQSQDQETLTKKGLKKFTPIIIVQQYIAK